MQAALELKTRGFDVLMVNSNPETVSTDYDVATRLYFEPLTAEDVLNVIDAEKPVGVIVQLGGQTPLKLARALHEAGVPLWGTPYDGLDLAENRERFHRLVHELGLQQPESRSATTRAEALDCATALGYPVLVRPSYVLGGRGMRVLYEPGALEAWLRTEVEISADEPVLIDKFLQSALEVDVDAVADAETVLIGAVMEHIEEAGIHSGDSTCVIPPFTLGDAVIAQIREITARLARALGVRGLLNVQYAVRDDQVFVLEANPRASRTIPFVSKATGLPLARLAARVMAGDRLADLAPAVAPEASLVCVKKPVLPFARSRRGRPLGPRDEMTGRPWAMIDSGAPWLPTSARASRPAGGTCGALATTTSLVTFMAKKLVELGHHLVATRGTARFPARHGRHVARWSLHEGQPNAIDLLEPGEVQLVINVPLGQVSEFDEKTIRERAVAPGVPVITTVAGAIAAVSGMEALARGPLDVSALQEIL